MTLTTFAYDACRHYVEDHLTTGLIGDELASRIHGWIRQRNLVNLSSCCSKIGPPEALSRGEMKFLMQVEAFFKKNAVYTDGARCEAAAHQAFIEAEEQCRATNLDLDYLDSDIASLIYDEQLTDYVTKASMYISRVLGPFSAFIDSLPANVRVTAGATSTRKRVDALPPVKVGKRTICSAKAERYVQALSQFFGYGRKRCTLLEWNRVEFVPKNWKTHRTIACEPEGNIPLQLAFDTYAKQRLRKRVGIDLSDQSVNRELARVASEDGSLATVDLKAASDTIAFNVVYALFPWEWANYLDDIRSKFYSDNRGKTMTRYEKFSSMGNGSTFCVETLIFAALSYAVGSKRYSVYGDDIVIETELYDELKRVLIFLGFTINVDKTHTTGPFRESCGGNYYRGIDITPFYIRNVDRRKAVKCHNVNGLAMIAIPHGALWNFLRDYIAAEKLPMVPWSENTMSGIHIDVNNAYSLGLIKSSTSRYGGSQPAYKAYMAKTREVTFTCSKASFLWYLQVWQKDRLPLGTTHRKVGNSGRTILQLPSFWTSFKEPVISSRYTTPMHKYVRDWVRWYPPAAVAPLQLTSWGDYLVR